MTVRIERARADHLERFKLELLPEDDAEAQACGCANAFTAFSLLAEQSIEAYAAVLLGPPWFEHSESRVGAMLGVRPRREADGVQLWFHSTDLFTRYPLAFLKPMRRLFDELLERHQVLHGMIDPRNEAMIRLSTWLGFELGAVKQVGTFKFHPAVVRRQTHG